jgi:hypothetical protein
VFALGHGGIGLWAAKAVDRDPPLKSLLLGTLLPDLIDKPLYYGLSWATGRGGAALGVIAGTRTFGHTILLTAAVCAAGAARRSRALTAVSLGMATHLALDVLTDACVHRGEFSLRAYAWPLLGWRFPAYPYGGLHEHLATGLSPFLLGAEALGAALLLREWLRRRRPA